MQILKSSDYKLYSKFIENLANKLTTFYYSKLNKPFKVSNKLRGGYDPVTTADKAFERFIRNEIKKNFPNHQIIGEEFGHKKTESEYSWTIDPIDGTRSFVIGNPTWSNLISLSYKGNPVIGLANFPVLRKYYFNTSLNSSYVSENGKKRKLNVNHRAKFSDIKLSAGFYGSLSLDQQKKIPRILKKIQFPCADALSYSHFAEGKLDVVIQGKNKIWDIRALIPIIVAAKGIVSTWNYGDPKNGGNIICSPNKVVHKKIIRLLRPVSN